MNQGAGVLGAELAGVAVGAADSVLAGVADSDFVGVAGVVAEEAERESVR